MQCIGLQYSLTFHQSRLKSIISYKSSLSDALICFPWFSLEDGATLLFILFLWIKFLNKSAQWHLNFCTQSLTRFSFQKQNSHIVQSNWLPAALISALIGRCNRKVCVMRKYNGTEKCSIRHCTHTLECVESKARESVIKFLLQWIICNYTCQGIKQFGFSLNLVAILWSLIRLQAKLDFIQSCYAGL